MDERARQRQFEQQLHAQLRVRAMALTRGTLPADTVRIESTSEGADELRDVLRRLELFDRRLVDELPGALAAQFTFQKSRLGGLLKQTVSRARVRVLAPIEDLAEGREPRPVGREQVLSAIARYQVLPSSARPSAMIFASPTGFTPEARRLVEENAAGGASLVLLGGRRDGGWEVDMPAAVRRTPWARLFQLESQDDRLKRLLYHLEQNAMVVDSRGIPLGELAGQLGVTETDAELLVRQACRTNPRVMTVAHNGAVHVCRAPIADEGTGMSLWSRIRKLLRLKPTAAERVRELTAQRVRLEQARHEIDQKVSSLEGEERAALEQARAATTDVERKQIAGRLLRARRDLGRLRAQANMYTQQIDILGAHLHHVTLTETGRRMQLPSSQELTAEAAQAEQIMAELASNADLARGIEVKGETPMMQEEEAAIMDELRALSASSAGEKKAEPAGPTASPAAERAGAAAAPSRAPSAPPVPNAPSRAAERAEGSRSDPAKPEIS